MRKLIETQQEHLIVCDNKNCDFTIPNKQKVDIKYFIDTPCPKCGENLLTLEDYIQHLKLIKTVNWLNKWFSWLTIFLPKKRSTISVHCHDGLHIKEEKNE